MSRLYAKNGAAILMSKVIPFNIEHGCPHCNGKVFCGYKGNPYYQKCYECGMTSWRKR